MLKKNLQKYSDKPSFRAAIQSLLLVLDTSGTSNIVENYLAGYGTNLQNQRLSKLIEEINVRLKDVEGLTVLLTDELYDLFRAASEGSVKTSSEEKIKRFANILANKVLDQNSDWDEAQMAITTLSAMNDLHLQILAKLKSVDPYIPDPNNESKNDLPGKKLIFLDDGNFLSSVSAKQNRIGSLLPEYSQVLIELACADLSSKSFLFDEKTNFFAPDGKAIFSLTETGEWFMKWISKNNH